MTLLLLLRQKERQNSEIRMTASVLKQDPNTKGSEECYLLGQSTTCASFRGKYMRDLCKRRRHGVWEGGGWGWVKRQIQTGVNRCLRSLIFC